jgi:hypothetical protein
MKYETIRPMSRAAVEAALTTDDPKEVARALLSAALHLPEREWVEGRCLMLLDSPDILIRKAAVLSLGHLARIHRELDKPTVMAALERVREDPELSGILEDALDDINRFVP